MLAFAWGLLFTPIGRYLGIGLLSTLLIGGAYIKGDVHGRAIGKAEIQRRWDDAIAADIKRGEDARRQAEQYVDSHPTVAGPPTGLKHLVPGRLRKHDQWDRDKGAVQPMAPYSLLGQQGHPGNGQGGARPQPHGPTPAVLVKPAAAPSCATVRMAVHTLPKDVLDAYAAKATPEQRAAAAECLKGK